MMTMNKKCYLQTSPPWASLPYPKAPWYIRNCGCGEVATTNSLIEIKKYQKYTPSTIQPYMKQFAEAHGNGTYHSGIPTALKHYGLTEVAEHATMNALWKELAKGDRIAILLMGSKLGGKNKIRWTGSGHFIAVTGYKKKDGLHYVYVKDSASTSKSRNGWITYEGNIRNACLKCWSGKLNGTLADTAANEVVKVDGQLVVDGIGGTATVAYTQKYFGVTVSGVVYGQNADYAMYYPALTAVEYGKGGSAVVKKIQKWCGIQQDGIWGKGTSAALQNKLKKKKYYKGIVDGIFGAMSMTAWQNYLNDNIGKKPVYPDVDPLQPWYDALEVQYKWSKNQKYNWVKPTIASSKKEGTCVTEPAVAMQRLGILKSGQYIYLVPETGKLLDKSGAIKKHPDVFKVMYPKKAATKLEGTIKKGDMCMWMRKSKSKPDHIMVFMGWNNEGFPIWDTMGHKRGLKIRYEEYENRPIDIIVRLKKVTL